MSEFQPTLPTEELTSVGRLPQLLQNRHYTHLALRWALECNRLIASTMLGHWLLACAISSTIICLCSPNMMKAPLIGFVAVVMSQSAITTHDMPPDIFFLF